MYDAASLATMKFIVARNTVMYVLCMQLHTPRGVGMTKWGTKKAACGQALNRDRGITHWKVESPGQNVT